jgi:hypothetical protein
MTRRVSLLWIIMLVCAIIPPPPLRVRPVAAQAAPGATPATPLSSSALIPLPARCGGTLPPSAGVPACCVSGYVLIEGQPVANAEVTITSPRGTAVFWTQQRPNHPQPYYRASLSEEPLQVEAGEVITLTAKYSSHTTTITHEVVAGGQQVDLVLHQASAHDYHYAGQIWQRSQPGDF